MNIGKLSSDRFSIEAGKQFFRPLYIVSISCIGLFLFGRAFTFIDPTFDNATLVVLILLAILTCLPQIGSLFLSSTKSLGIEITYALWVASALLFGPDVAPIVTGCAGVGFTIKQLFSVDFSPLERFKRATFNMGMWCIECYLMGHVYLLINPTHETWIKTFLAWGAVAFTGLLVNITALGIVFWLHDNGTPFTVYTNAKEFHHQDLVFGWIGGGLFAFTLAELGPVGIVIIALPLLLSLVVIRTHLKSAEAQMEELERMVSDRTVELSAANKELQMMALQKAQVLAVLSHDMKTPLAAIRLYGQLLLNNYNNPRLKREKLEKQLRTILHNEAALTDLVGNIVEVERLQSGTVVHLTETEYDLSEAFDLACHTVEPQAIEKSIALTITQPDPPILVRADKAKIQRVMINLLSNAVKYTPAGGSVHATLNHNDNGINITITDTGYGIPEDDLNNIFEPYHRVESNKKYAKGTGLGLSIVSHFVDAHGGKIDVESAAGEGSTFRIHLPINVATSADSDTATIVLPDTQSSSQHLQPVG